MKILLTHPTGNANVRAIIKSLAQANMLAAFNTTISIAKDSIWLSLVHKDLREQFLRRNYSIPAALLQAHPLTELARILLPKIGFQRYTKKENAWASIDSVYRKLDYTVSRQLPTYQDKKGIKAVYSYEDGALQTFQQAKALGLTCIYDLPIAYWETGRRLMQEEAERLPEWAHTLGGGINDSEAKLERKTKELELADIVVGPGSFVMNSLPEWAKQKRLILAPFGSPGSMPIHELNQPAQRGRKLRVLFAGSMTQRKGLGDLFAAMKLLNTSQIELIVMGSAVASLPFYKSQLPSFTYLQNRPHAQVLELMRSCDLFCLPSIVEGRALVMQEAMSQGLPLIITANTGGEDLIKEGSTGFMVPIRSAEAIACKLQWFLDNRNHIRDMGQMAQEHAARYTWDAYGTAIISGLLNQSFS